MIRCSLCGRFIAYDALQEGRARVNFTPDNAFGPERTEFLCPKCNHLPGLICLTLGGTGLMEAAGSRSLQVRPTPKRGGS